MANWNGLQLTNKGIALQAKVQAGTQLHITKLKLGSGVVPSGTDVKTLTDLIAPEQNLGIGGKEAVDDYCKISSTISNTGLEAGYYVRELGVFAQDPDDGEILYMYTTDGAPDYLPAGGGSTVISQEFSVMIAVDDTDNVVVDIDPAALATMGYVQLQIQEHNTDTTAHADFTGATAETAGKRGMVPAPAAGDQNKALFGDKSYKSVVQSINGITPDAGGGITLVTGINMLARNQTYQYGDIAYSNNLPSWAYLYCVQAGTTAASEPSFSSVNAMGQYITDGTVKWIVDDIRFNTPVGVVFYDSYLHAGCVKYNGATVQRSDYIRIAKIATDENLWTESPSTEPWKYGVGDGSTTMVLPDFRNRFIEGGDTPMAQGPGLPNIVGDTTASSETYFSTSRKGFGAFSLATSIGTSEYLIPNSSTKYSHAGYLHFDASLSNEIYDKTDKVLPESFALIAQIKY